MKKMKRTMAITGAFLLLSLYATTLVLALIDHPGTMNAFRATLYCTIIIPIMIWVYTFIYKLLNDPDHTASDTQRTDAKKAED